MLIDPKSVVSLWSDYDIQLLDPETILSAFLDGLPALRKLESNLRDIVEAGIDSDEAAKYLEAACYWLSRDCVRQERYFLNVGLRQYLDYDRAKLLRTAEAYRRTAQSRWSQLFSGSRGFDRLPRGGPVGSRVENIEPWSKAPPLLRGDVVTIDAPLCFLEFEEKPAELFLSDYPDFLRKPSDPRVRLKSSSSLVEKMKRGIPRQLEWHPFCRTLGFVEKGGIGDCVRVLQISMRTPIHGAPGWATELVDEAGNFRYYGPRSTDDWFSQILSACETLVVQARKKSPGKTDAEIQEECGGEFAATLKRIHTYVYESVVGREDTAYEDINGFWTGVTTVLQDWREQFPMSGPEKHALLQYFDVAYTDERKRTANLLSIVGATRFNSETIARMRRRLEQLGS